MAAANVVEDSHGAVMTSASVAGGQVVVMAAAKIYHIYLRTQQEVNNKI